MTTYSFNYGHGDAVRDKMAAITRQLQDELRNMTADVDKTLADWQDDAKTEYHTSKHKWNTAAARMPFSLAKAELVLAEISNGYLKVEHTGTNMWGGYTVK